MQSLMHLHGVPLLVSSCARIPRTRTCLVGGGFLVIDAYLDESGTGPRDPALVIAGHIAPPDAWARLSIAWQSLMEEWGLRYFHMVDFERRKTPYADWPEPVRRDRLNLLLDLILETVTASISIAVPTDRFTRVFGERGSRNLKFAVAARALFWELSKFDRDGGQPGWLG